MEYSAFVHELYALREEEFAVFQEKIIRPRALKIIGVRTPELRKLVKKYRRETDALFSFPDEYYETVFLRLNVAALLPYTEFLSRLDACVRSIENWALCDTFKPRCLERHTDDFLPYIEKYLLGGEFSQRFSLVTLLSFYMKEEYLPVIFDALQRCDTAFYYTYMGAAWLLAEVLVKFYEEGKTFLQKNLLDVRTHNKAIQKARESFRLTTAQKEQLSGLKRR